MARINWRDAYPDYVDRSESRAWLTIETDDSLWDIPCEVADFPTRPSDAELWPYESSIYGTHMTVDELRQWQAEEQAERDRRASWKRKP